MADQPPAAPFHQRAELERTRRGWSKGELAQRAGIGRITYERLPTQPTPPIPRTIRKLCAALDIDLAEGLHLAGLAPATPLGAVPGQPEQLSSEDRVAAVDAPSTGIDLDALLRKTDHSGLVCWQCIDAATRSSEQEPRIFPAITVADGTALCFVHVVAWARAKRR